jgi:hypothetical protein
MVISNVSSFGGWEVAIYKTALKNFQYGRCHECRKSSQNSSRKTEIWSILEKRRNKVSIRSESILILVQNIQIKDGNTNFFYCFCTESLT